MSQTDTLAGSIILPILLVALALFETRRRFLCIESQILHELRKMKKRFTKSEVKNLLTNDTNSALEPPELFFSTAYISLSKDDHPVRRRNWEQAFYCFLILLDVFDMFFYSPELLKSDAAIGLRVFIALGSLTVWKVHNDRVKNSIIIFFVCVIYLILLFRGSALNSPYDNRGFNIFSVVSFIVVVGFELYHGITNVSVQGTEVSDIALAIHKNQPLTEQQMNRFEQMKLRSSSTYVPTSNLFKRHKGFIKELPFIIMFIINLGASALWLSHAPFELWTAVAVQDIADFVGYYSLVMNRLQVEPMLFVELLELAHDKNSQV